MTYSIRSATAVLAVAALTVLSTGCAGMSQTQRGAVIGAAGGAAAGAVIGKVAGSTAKGAIIGAAVGGTAGAIIGSRMDDVADEMAADLPNARVERVGEGILVTFDSGILFDFDSSVVKGSARDNLAQLASHLQANPETELVVVGHTDSQGTEEYNDRLSQRRAEAAATYLAQTGVNYTRIRTTGLGESEPVANNDSEAGRQQNRRVEVAIFANEEYRERMIRQHGGQ